MIAVGEDACRCLPALPPKLLRGLDTIDAGDACRVLANCCCSSSGFASSASLSDNAPTTFIYLPYNMSRVLFFRPVSFGLTPFHTQGGVIVGLRGKPRPYAVKIAQTHT